jgi:4-amino-4-deoxy-L-arabinose transferase-like glycosyltransferase
MKQFVKNIGTFIKTHPKTDVVILLIGLAVFVTITLLNAPRASIWFDEAFSAYIIQFNYWDIARYTANDVHPPFYYWVLKSWTLLFGTTDLALRSLSIVFGAGVITTVFTLTRKLFSRSTAWVSLLLLVLSPMLIRYSDEARMYTLAALIIFIATYVLVRATETKSRKLWIVYGALVALGMWTHYFTAFAWLAHWAWRAVLTWKKGTSFKAFLKALFSRNWIIAYSIAFVAFLPWLIVMGYQLGVVQASGFWIGPVGVTTPANYATNYFYYLEYYQTQGWLAFLVLAIVALGVVLVPKVYRSLTTKERSAFLLISSLAWVPVVLLFIMSLPPLRPSFVERYLIPSIIALSVFLAIVLVIGTRRWRPILRILPVLAIVGMMVFGITNVFTFGNFNKNTNYHIFTKEVIEEIHQKGKPGQPIIAETPWMYYEAVQYATPDFPVYFLNDSTDYEFGSLDMLKYNDRNKIINLDAFEKQHPTIWFIGQNEFGELGPYTQSWQRLQNIQITDELTGRTIYRAAEFSVR